MTIHAIERIGMPDARTFYEHYVSRRRPVVITDMFAGNDIRGIGSLREAHEAFDDVRLRTRIEYITALENAKSGEGPVMSFGEYWNQIHHPAQYKLICTECEIPARVMLQFELPESCRALDLHRPEILDLPKRYGDHDLYTYVFMAPEGQTTHLHYDGDHRQILLYQLFGAKEFFLIEPEAGAQIRQLATREGFTGMFGVFFGELSQRDKLALVDAANGYHTVLGPGEALYMPMLIWHHVEYLQDAMSINVRFGRNRLGRFLCIDNFHQDYFVQNVAALMSATTLDDGELAPAIRSIVEEYGKPAANRDDKVRAMRKFFSRLCMEYCPRARADEFYEMDSETPEMANVMQIMGERMLYMRPEEISRTRPKGAISPLQKNLLREAARKLRYSEQTLEHILRNRLAKSSIDALSKAEAVQLHAYLSTPEAQM